MNSTIPLIVKENIPSAVQRDKKAYLANFILGVLTLYIESEHSVNRIEPIHTASITIKVVTLQHIVSILHENSLHKDCE